MRNLDYAVQKVTSVAGVEGLHKTSLPWLTIVRADQPTAFEMVLYEPSVCIVLQGKKETRLEHGTYQSNASKCVLGALNLPVLAAVTEATPALPYLCPRIDIDSAVIAELVDNGPLPEERPAIVTGMALGETDDELMDTVCRLLDTLESVTTSKALAPLIQKELYWRLLQQIPLATLILQLVKDGKHHGLYKVINWLEANFSQSVTVDDLAQRAGMSLSGFYARFKTVTGISPLQYRNRLRLVRARKLMIARGYDAAQAGFEVGYQEPAQFSREYSRLFGLPPKRDISRIKTAELTAFV
jgi:AraC-like DNA-binding protein